MWSGLCSLCSSLKPSLPQSICSKSDGRVLVPLLTLYPPYLYLPIQSSDAVTDKAMPDRSVHDSIVSAAEYLLPLLEREDDTLWIHLALNSFSFSSSCSSNCIENSRTILLPLTLSCLLRTGFGPFAFDTSNALLAVRLFHPRALLPLCQEGIELLGLSASQYSISQPFIHVSKVVRRYAKRHRLSIDRNLSLAFTKIQEQHPCGWLNALQETLLRLHERQWNGVQCHSFELWDIGGEELVAALIGCSIYPPISPSNDKSRGIFHGLSAFHDGRNTGTILNTLSALLMKNMLDVTVFDQGQLHQYKVDRMGSLEVPGTVLPSVLLKLMKASPLHTISTTSSTPAAKWREFKEPQLASSFLVLNAE